VVSYEFNRNDINKYGKDQCDEHVQQENFSKVSDL
jgi:hypothetical protein